MPMMTLRASAIGAPGDTEFHYGYLCQVTEDRALVADVPDELVASEVAAGRAELLEAPTKRTRQKSVE